MNSVERIRIHTEYVKLDQFLKLESAVSTGGEAKVRILSGDVRVNGKIEERRGKKLRAGDVVTLDQKEYEVIQDQ